MASGLRPDECLLDRQFAPDEVEERRRPLGILVEEGPEGLRREAHRCSESSAPGRFGTRSGPAGFPFESTVPAGVFFP